MGDFYKKEEKVVEEKEDNIKDYKDLKVIYQMEDIKYQQTVDEAGEAIMPYRIKLFGDRKQIEGEVEWIIDYMRDKRYDGMSIKTKVEEMINSIKSIDGWDMRYIHFLQNHIETFKRISRSAIKMIDEQTKQIEELKAKVEVPRDSEREGIRETRDEKRWDNSPVSPEEMKRFEVMFLAKMNEYIAAIRMNNPNAKFMKGTAFSYCGKSWQKREYAEKIFDYMVGKGNVREINSGTPEDPQNLIKKILKPGVDNYQASQNNNP